MSIKFSCGSCGKKLKVDDRYAGRDSKCPACGWQIHVPREATWEEDDSPEPSSPAPPLPVPLAAAVPVPAARKPVGSVKDDDDELEPWRPSKTPATHQGYARRVLLAGTGVGALALVAAFGFVALRRPAKGTDLRPAAAVKEEAPAPKSPEAPREREPIRPEDMPDAAQLWVMMYIDGTLKANPGTENVRVNDVEVKPIRDQRKIDWLWEAMATVTVSKRSDVPGQASDQFSMTWRMVFEFTPYWYSKECWREVLDMKFGQKYRKHFGHSEWRREFRDDIRSRWSRAFRTWDAEMQRRGESGEDRARYLQDFRQGAAKEVGLSVEELQEIVEAID